MQPYGEQGLVFPVGFPCGLVGDGEASEGLVRAGSDYVALSRELYQLWLDQVERPEFDERARDLEERGVLVRLLGRVENDQGALDSLRLLLLACGVGCVAGGEGLYFATAKGPTVRLDAATYFLLIRCGAGETVWQACVASAAELEIPVERTVRAVLAALPVMLSTRSALLDRVA